ncbi:MAG: hypothetical protein AAB458_02180 [Patescibacteria group bacterium]
MKKLIGCFAIASLLALGGEAIVANQELGFLDQDDGAQPQTHFAIDNASSSDRFVLASGNKNFEGTPQTDFDVSTVLFAVNYDMDHGIEEAVLVRARIDARARGTSPACTRRMDVDADATTPADVIETYFHTAPRVQRV